MNLYLLQDCMNDGFIVRAETGGDARNMVYEHSGTASWREAEITSLHVLAFGVHGKPGILMVGESHV